MRRGSVTEATGDGADDSARGYADPDRTLGSAPGRTLPACALLAPPTEGIRHMK